MATATNRPQTGWNARELLASIGWLFPRSTLNERVATTLRFEAAPEEVWQAILFYEEVPFPPPLILRFFLPHPVRTQGDKTSAGSIIECVYNRGGLIKQITGVEPPNLVRFDVLEQHLGVEGCISMVGGSYQIRADVAGSEVTLTTVYRGHLRPRVLWRPLERFLAHRVHRYILSGVGAKLAHLTSITGF